MYQPVISQRESLLDGLAVITTSAVVFDRLQTCTSAFWLHASPAPAASIASAPTTTDRAHFARMTLLPLRRRVRREWYAFPPPTRHFCASRAQASAAERPLRLCDAAAQVGAEPRWPRRGSLAKLRLLDHLIGASKQGCRQVEAERLGGDQIEDEFKFGRLLDRKAARPGPPQKVCQPSRQRCETSPRCL